jgi:hypothetical protein
MTSHLKRGLLVAWAALLFSPSCSAADGNCEAFNGAYVQGRPVGKERSLVLEFNPFDSSTGETLFRSTAQAIEGGPVKITHRKTDNFLGHQEWYFRRVLAAKSPDAVFHLQLCSGRSRPVLVRVDVVSGKQVLYLEPLP